MPQSNPIYLARICWNSQGWKFPTGEAKELEQDSYVTKTGFGHEEWLFDYSRMIGPYHYAFLQPVSHSHSRLIGQSIDVLLYSINTNGERLYVGEIANCQVLDDAEKGEALKHYKKRGWFAEMRSEVGNVGGIFSDADGLFNIKFLPQNAKQYGWPPPLAGPHDRVHSYNRYTLTSATVKAVLEWQRSSRRGSQIAPILHSVTRKGTPILTYDPIQVRMQAELLPILQSQFGKNAVTLEQDFVDVTVRAATRLILIEIKTEPDARRNIRLALGQLLEYAYFDHRNKSNNPELIVIGPAPLTAEVQAYLDELKARFGLGIRYLRHTSETPLQRI